MSVILAGGQMRKATRLLLVLLVLLGVGPLARAEVVNVWGDTGFVGIVNTFYDGLPDHSSTIVAGPLQDIDLAGVALLWIIQPSSPFNSEAVSALSDFLAAGGRIAFMGEHGGFMPTQNDNISAALAALGSNIQIQNITVETGYRVVTRVDGSILDHPLTEGVDTYRYGAFAPLIMSGPAEVLMYGQDHAYVMMGYENIGPGSVFLITDQNVFDDPYAEDNEVMFENLLTGQTGAPPPAPPPPAGPAKPVPTVSQWTLAGLGALLALLGYAGLRRRV